MALVAGTALSDTVCLATGELPPYATEQRPDQGIALEIVRRSFALAGATVHYTMKSPTAKRQAL
jgi:polar amino acid transport system substrate-binding protein